MEAAEAGWAAVEALPLDPLPPLRVHVAVGLLVPGLEDADDLAVGIPDKVAAAAALSDDVRVDALLDGGLGLIDEFGEKFFVVA